MAGVVGKVPGSGLLPASFTTTHNTDGLPGYGAYDAFFPAGTIVGLPVGGVVRRPGRTGGGGDSTVYGYRVYVDTDYGQKLFLTHFQSLFVREGQRIEAGEPIGRVAPYGNAPHIHIAVEGAADTGAKVALAGGGTTQAGRRQPTRQEAFEEFAPGGRGGTVGVHNLPNYLGLGRGGWLQENIGIFNAGGLVYRGGLIVGGGVLVVVGLLMAARQLGVPVPEPAPMRLGRFAARQASG